MAKDGVVSIQGRLDPTAQEFRPRTNNSQQQQQQSQPFFIPPPPIYYPYTSSPSLPSPPPPLHVASSSVPPPSAVPTRTLLLTSVPTDVSESLIRRELEIFGEVRSVQMERVLDGIVTVHFYDLRHAEMALKVIREQHVRQQSRLRDLFVSSSGGCSFAKFVPLPPSSPGLVAGHAVWAQFILPSRKAVPDGLNQGTIIVFNLVPSVSTSSLAQIFQAYGNIT